MEQQQQSIIAPSSSMDVNSFKYINTMNPKSEIPSSFLFSPSSPPIDLGPILLNLSPSALGDAEKPCFSINFGQQHPCNGYAVNFSMESREEEDMMVKNSLISILSNNQWGNVRTVSYPFNLPTNPSDEWEVNLP